ncbi:uncharacterized protein LOC132551112 [Ylistrum balloti]|uniref:uncharacterized protein LOC132551112 n=1 Tax=Ylistrum balloti TaxID=509963 RepID=UPI002905ED57|nr:uncharacterized protein LOC132551112 [Ylistrum balloti]
MNRTGHVVLGVVIFACIVALVLGLYFGLRKSEDVKSNKVFLDSFSASLDVDTVERSELGTEKTYLKVEWNSDTMNMRIQETEVFASEYDFDYDLVFIMVNDKATVSISHMNTSIAFCLEETSLSRWLSVFDHIVKAKDWISGSQSDKCRGDIWSTNLEDGTIDICTYDNQLEYVAYKERNAMVTSWSRSDKQSINIASDVQNGPCHKVRVVNCSNIHDAPAVKRDSGVAPATCLFVHGAGENVPGNSVLQDQSSYWGNVKSFTSKCVSHKFLIYNSRFNGWDVDHIHQHFCDVAAPNGIISNTVIFSHSMGNMVIAAALHRNKCSFDEKTSRWFSVQGPWTGSAVADKLSSICRNPTFIERLIRRVLRGQGYCKPTENIENGVYTTLKTDYVSDTGVQHNDLINIGKRYVSGVMCGDSSWGLGQDKLESAALWLMQAYSNLGDPNDGMVAFDSCKLKDEVFEARSSHSYYKDKFNHADGTCRHGGCPCRWYHNMH